MSDQHGQQQGSQENRTEGWDRPPAAPEPEHQPVVEADQPVYRVRAIPRERVWMVDVPDVGLTQAGRLGDVEPRARDLISLRRGDDQAYRVDVEVHLDQSIRDDVETATRARAEATALETRADQAMASAARKLLASTVSLRDAAQILGMSHQRLSALARAEHEQEGHEATTVA